MVSLADLPLPVILALVGASLFGFGLGYLLHARVSARRARRGAVRTAPSPRPFAPPLREFVQHTAAVSRPVPRPEAATAAQPPEGSTAVLIADDQPQILALHAAYLQKHGYRVFLAEDGRTALERARLHRPDVIVLDYTMGTPNGVEVARALKDDIATAHIPILLLTAHSYGAVGPAARAAGCSAFLSKPLMPSRLLHEIATHLADSRARGQGTRPGAN
jgi:two-component system, cell cycle response regulator DivK